MSNCHTYIYTHIHTRTYTYTHILSLSMSLSHIHTHTLCLCLSLTHKYTYAHLFDTFPGRGLTKLRYDDKSVSISFISLFPYFTGLFSHYMGLFWHDIMLTQLRYAQRADIQHTATQTATHNSTHIHVGVIWHICRTPNMSKETYANQNRPPHIKKRPTKVTYRLSRHICRTWGTRDALPCQQTRTTALHSRPPPALSMPHPAAQLAPEVQSIYIYVKICQKRPIKKTYCACNAASSSAARSWGLFTCFVHKYVKRNKFRLQICPRTPAYFICKHVKSYMYEQKKPRTIPTALVMPHPEALLASEVKSIHKYVKRGLHVWKRPVKQTYCACNTTSSSTSRFWGANDLQMCQKRPTYMKKDQWIRPTKLAMPHPAAPLASEVIQICQKGPTYEKRPTKKIYCAFNATSSLEEPIPLQHTLQHTLSHSRRTNFTCHSSRTDWQCSTHCSTHCSTLQHMVQHTAKCNTLAEPIGNSAHPAAHTAIYCNS